MDISREKISDPASMVKGVSSPSDTGHGDEENVADDEVVAGVNAAAGAQGDL